MLSPAIWLPLSSTFYHPCFSMRYENTPDQWTIEDNWKRCAALLQFWWTQNGPLLVNNLLIFLYKDSLIKPSLVTSSITKCLTSSNYKPAAVSSFNQVISWHQNNSVEYWTNSHGNAFSRLAKALQQFLCQKLLLTHSRETQKMFVPVCCCYCCAAL